MKLKVLLTLQVLFIDYGAEVYLMKSQLTDKELNYLDYHEYSHIHNIKILLLTGEY